MIELQARGACYSWRLPPPRWLGGGGVSVKLARRLCKAPDRDCEGCCARPAGDAKSNSS